MTTALPRIQMGLTDTQTVKHNHKVPGQWMGHFYLPEKNQDVVTKNVYGVKWAVRAPVEWPRFWGSRMSSF